MIKFPMAGRHPLKNSSPQLLPVLSVLRRTDSPHSATRRDVQNLQGHRYPFFLLSGAAEPHWALSPSHPQQPAIQYLSLIRRSGGKKSRAISCWESAGAGQGPAPGHGFWVPRYPLPYSFVLRNNFLVSTTAAFPSSL